MGAWITHSPNPHRGPAGVPGAGPDPDPRDLRVRPRRLPARDPGAHADPLPGLLPRPRPFPPPTRPRPQSSRGAGMVRPRKPLFPTHESSPTIHHHQFFRWSFWSRGHSFALCGGLCGLCGAPTVARCNLGMGVGWGVGGRAARPSAGPRSAPWPRPASFGGGEDSVRPNEGLRFLAWCWPLRRGLCRRLAVAVGASVGWRRGLMRMKFGAFLKRKESQISSPPLPSSPTHRRPPSPTAARVPLPPHPTRVSERRRPRGF